MMVVQPEGVPNRMSGRAVSTRSGGMLGRASGALLTGPCQGDRRQAPADGSRWRVLTAPAAADDVNSLGGGAAWIGKSFDAPSPGHSVGAYSTPAGGSSTAVARPSAALATISLACENWEHRHHCTLRGCSCWCHPKVGL